MATMVALNLSLPYSNSLTLVTASLQQHVFCRCIMPSTEHVTKPLATVVYLLVINMIYVHEEIFYWK